MKMASNEAEYDPICPHCEKELKEVHWRQVQAVNAEYLFIGPKCRTVIGVGARKVAWIQSASIPPSCAAPIASTWHRPSTNAQATWRDRFVLIRQRDGPPPRNSGSC